MKAAGMIAVMIMVCFSLSAFAEQPLADRALEARARRMMQEIRCVVCAAQSVADSDATLAGDMRQMIRDHLASGQSEAEIRCYLRQRYGDGIFLRPGLNAQTWLLWFFPMLILAIGGLVIRGLFRQKTIAEAADD